MELDVAGDGGGCCDGIVGDGGFLLKELVDADDGGGSALEEVDDPADGDERPSQLHHVHVERGELSHGDPMGDDLMTADEESNHEGETEDELERGPKHGHEANEMETAADVFLIGSLEGGDLGVFLGEGTDEACAGEVFLGLGRDVGVHGLDALEATMDAVAEVLNKDGGGGHRDEGEESQLRTDAVHERQRGSHEDDGVGAVHDGGAEELADGVQVVGGAGHNVAGAVGVVEDRGLPLKICEEIVAEVELDLAGGSDDDLAGDVEEDRRKRGDEQEAEGMMEDYALGEVVLHVVNGVADDGWEQHLDDVVENDRNPAPGE